MEQTALRPKPMPGQEPGGGPPSDGRPRHPHAARRRGRRLTTLLFGMLVGTVLVLSGVGLGTVGATVIGASKLAELQRQTGGAAAGAVPQAGPRPSAPFSAPFAPAEQADATLGLEIVDAEKAGAEIVAVHVPGPGYSAGLVRGDVVLHFGRNRIDSAADLARAVEEAKPGKEVKVTVRHESGGYQQLTVVPGIVT
ncbi:PDZ domain-containing protein [Streptomyces galilaeus]|uniref:PDZ domain-containing protein n=1 Tax=Streptomyces galilaeus TaxID=33899 RepID=UPI00123DE5C6|nr:PDZ domain-containing protein [Streptomyces galilaeus]QEU68757.1 PDZ domain-containing protein [Streptomyces galilaeus]GGW24376.1 PDZ domain-containing protein [Streptomyces galilaeus]